MNLKLNKIAIATRKDKNTRTHKQQTNINVIYDHCCLNNETR